MRPKVLIVFVTAMLASTAMLLAITRPPVPSNIPTALDPNRIKGEIISVQQVEVGQVWTEEFGFWLPKDAGITRSCDVGTITDGRRWVDPNTGEKFAEYTVTYTPLIAGYDYVNFTCTPIPEDPNQAVKPDTRTVILEVSNPPLQGVIYLVQGLDPGYDYTAARIDPRAYQAAKKHQQAYEYARGWPITYNPRF